MNRRARLVSASSIAAALMFAVTGCKGGTETQPTNPKPPAQAAPSPTAPAPQAAPSGAGGSAAEAPAAPEANEEKPSGTAVAVSPEAKKEADDLFSSLCSTCHGTDGSGNGPAAAAFNPKPANFASPEFQKRVDDAEIAKVIVEGGPAVGKSPLMPPNPQLKDKPEVVQALVQKIRAFGKAAQ